MSDRVEQAELVDSPSVAAGWFAVAGGIAAWMAHLTAEASLVGLVCQHPDLKWTMHAATAACVLVTLTALAVSVRLVRTPSTPWQFVGWLGVISSVVNVVLIVFEGSYVIFIRPCG